jgi:hypothetical protein
MLDGGDFMAILHSSQSVQGMLRLSLSLLGSALGDRLRTRNAIKARTLGVCDFRKPHVEAAFGGAKKCED